MEKGMAIHSSVLAWKIPWTEEPASYSPWGRKESDTTQLLILSLPAPLMGSLEDPPTYAPNVTFS